MNKIIIAAMLTAIVTISCSSASTGIFGKKTPLEKYEEKLEDSGLEKTPEGRLWLSASEKALAYPVGIQLPYRHAGRFSLTKPQAIGLQFSAKQGQRLTFQFKKTDSTSFVLYAELYRQEADGKTTLLQSPDTNVAEFYFDVADAGNYLLKIQPQLFRVGSYDLSISTGPSLRFPVDDKKAYIGSVWGDVRDGGKRNHEGVDIFAAKGTPAVAATDGYVTAVREGGIGGKTVWLRPEGKNYTLYYAHLDEQLVKEGQFVKKGDVVGLVGNTGNARTTPAHLHFGIYGYGGAIDPFLFVNRQVKQASAASQKKLTEFVRLTKDVKLADVNAKKHSLLMPVAVTANSYIAELPDGRMIQTLFSAVQAASQPLKKSKASSAITLYNTPLAELSGMKIIPAGSSVSVLGYFNEFAFVEAGQSQGWVLETALKG